MIFVASPAMGCLVTENEIRRASNEDIFGFDVAVNDVSVVGVL